MAAAAVVYDDLIVDILAKLPVKSLLRFNCVCKTWYSTISDPQFSNNLHSMRRSCFLLSENLRDFSTITPEALLTKKYTAPTPLPLPLDMEHDSKNIFLGSCNGLICVYHISNSPGNGGLIVCNPSTRKFKRLPCPIWHSYYKAYVWFGYDERIDDYKLIWLSSRVPNRFLEDLEVFTLKPNTWSRRPLGHTAAILGMPYRPRFKAIGELSKGAIHWLIQYLPPNHAAGDIIDDYAQSVECILAIDLATEVFRLLEFPQGSGQSLGSLGGCLCICTGGNDDYGKDLWVMKEYGLESSWTKLLSINLLDLSGSPHSVYPLIFSKEEGKEIVMAVSIGKFGIDYSSGIVKFRVEEGTNKAMLEEFLFGVRLEFNNVMILPNLHMEESLVSF